MPRDHLQFPTPHRADPFDSEGPVCQTCHRHGSTQTHMPHVLHPQYKSPRQDGAELQSHRANATSLQRSCALHPAQRLRTAHRQPDRRAWVLTKHLICERQLYRSGRLALQDAVHDALSHLQVGHVALDDMEDLHDARQRRLLQLRLPPRPRLRSLRVLLLPRCAASSDTARCVLSPSSSPPPAAPPAAPLPPTPSSMAWVIQSSRRRGSAHSGLERRSSALTAGPLSFRDR